MKSPMPIILGGAALLLLTRKTTGIARPPAAKGGRKQLRCAFATTGEGDDWLRFLEVVAHRESRFNNLSENRSTKEAAAAQKGANRHAKTLSRMGWPLSAWGFGSGGWFGLLAPSAVIGGAGPRYPDAFIRKYGPDIVFEMGPSIASAISYARGLMGWKNFAGNWASLNIGWDNPSDMGNQARIARTIESMEDRAAEELGWARGWAGGAVPRPPSRSKAEYQALAETAQRAAEAC